MADYDCEWCYRSNCKCNYSYTCPCCYDPKEQCENSFKDYNLSPTDSDMKNAMKYFINNGYDRSKLDEYIEKKFKIKGS